MNKKKLLMIFIKNEELGKVKTRLASTLGDEKALKIYQKLLDKTAEVTSQLTDTDKIVYYSNFEEVQSRWPSDQFKTAVQYQGNLGERMSNAFQQGFESGYDQICIIGSDCWDLSTQKLKDAFRALDTHDFVIGGANDGGYYLIGMTTFLENLYNGKTFSTSSVYDEAISEITQAGKTLIELEKLIDIDVEEDLKKTLLWHHIKL